MSIKVIVDVDGAADWLAADATASFRLDRDTSAAFSAPTEVVTTVITTGTERYEVWDASGATTTWYRFRIEDDADVALSAWSIPFQVLASQEIANLAGVKLMLGTGASATDDDVLQAVIDGVNAAIIHRIGYYPGPSSDTTRSYHGVDAVRGGKRLWVPDGIRSLTSLSIASATGGTATAADSTAYMLGPAAYMLRPGEPYHYIEFLDVTTGDWSSFPYGFYNVEAVGLFGWATPPADLVHIATAWAIRRWKSRNTGDVDALGSDEFGNAIVSDRMPIEWRRAIDSYRMSWVA